MKFIYRLLKLNKTINNPQIKLLAIYFARLANIRHLSLRIDPITACNLKCRMCTVGKRSSKKVKKLSEEDRQRLGRMFFNKALQVVIGCGYEPTVHNRFMDYVSMARAYRIPYVGLTSNGQLLNEQHILQFIQHKLTEITISLHGVRKKTYQRLMINASYEKLRAFLEKLDHIKKKHNVNFPSLRMNFTINSENIDEVPLFFDYFGQYGIDTLQIRPMHGDCYPDGEFRGMDISKYQYYLKSLSEKCSSNNITLMAHIDDLGFSEDNLATIIYPEVFYRIDPDIVWRSGFDWRKETYDEYCRRIKYNRYLLSSVLTSKNKLLQRSRSFPGSGGFDIF